MASGWRFPWASRGRRLAIPASWSSQRGRARPWRRSRRCWRRTARPWRSSRRPSAQASTIGGVVAAGLAGPARPFAGAVRDHLLGVRVLDGQGRALRFGGTVFKNVAGFDAFRPMCGAMGTLGVILDVSIRVTPTRAERRTLTFDLDWPASQAMLTRLLRAPYPIDGAFHDGGQLFLQLSGPVDGVAGRPRASSAGNLAIQGVWRAVRDWRPAPVQRNAALEAVPPRAPPVSEALPGPAVFDWAGSQCWVATDAPADQMRRLAAGGRRSRDAVSRGAAPGEDVASTPLPAPLLHRPAQAAEGGVRSGGSFQPRPPVRGPLEPCGPT